MLKGRKQQSGVILLAFVMVIIFVVTATTAAIMAATASATAQNNKHVKQEWVEGVQARLAQFYQMNPAKMDGSANSQWSSGIALSHAANIKLKYRAALVIGPRKTLGNLSFRTLTLWIPDAQSKASQGFAPSRALVYETVDGRSIERSFVRDALEQMNAIGNELTAYYAGRINDDPAHNAGINYWQPPGCGPSGDGDWRLCANNWTGLANMESPIMGMPPAQLVNPWGLPLEGINASPQANDQSPPYTLLVRSPLPWGGALKSTVVEPINAG